MSCALFYKKTAQWISLFVKYYDLILWKRDTTL